MCFFMEKDNDILTIEESAGRLRRIRNASTTKSGHTISREGRFRYIPQHQRILIPHEPDAIEPKMLSLGISGPGGGKLNHLEISELRHG